MTKEDYFTGIDEGCRGTDAGTEPKWELSGARFFIYEDLKKG